MPQFCWFLKYIFLLVMMSQTQIIETRSLRSGPQSELIAGNEFLKLFLERDQFHSASDYQGGGADSSQVSKKSVAEEIGIPASSNRNNNARSLDYKGRHHDNNEHVGKDDKQQQQQQQVVKLVTSGSKIVFLEEYDDDDAVVDAVARDIDLQREQKPYKSNKNTYNPRYHNHNHNQKQISNSKQRYSGNAGDEVKLVGVSISSSSKRGSSAPLQPTTTKTITAKSVRNHQSDNYHNYNNNKYIYKYNDKPTHKPGTSSSTSTTTTSTTSTSTKRTTTTSTTERSLTTASPKRRDIASTWRPQSSLPYATDSEFINLSHKSELSIEETEPLTMTQQQQQRQRGKKSRMTSLENINDSENSASTNIQNVLAPPLPHAATDSAMNKMNTSGNDDNENDESLSAMGVEEEKKLLPFQTVIYHDTRNDDSSGEGHEPQSRSISYSSLSQNVEDIHAWQSTGSILAEAQRNVSESLKPSLNSNASPKGASSHDSGAKFYSVPAKMYGEASKFYSEPSKVYSEPAKVYGEPEKIYSEPSKVYSEPSKFYSEPAKVYSQPAKVYGEPSKTYWPTETSTTSTGAPINKYIPPSRRPNIVSRIAFGEAQIGSATTTTTTTTSTVKPPSSFGGYRNHHSHYTPTRQHSQAHQQLPQQQQHLTATNINNQPRRVLFNLDRLPYDLLNAPEQPLSQLPSEHPNLTDLSHGPISCFESELPLTASSTSNSAASTATAQTAVSSLTVTHQPQQQQLLLIQQRQQQQQHVSLSDQQQQQQHSNQNAKGLPNRDLVKCVAKYIHSSGTGPASSPSSSSSSTHFTTERAHIEDMYTPTPEQNYEIEESVSVMTNGRAHGIVGGDGGSTRTTRPTARNRLRINLGSGLHGRHHTEDDGSYKYHNNGDDGGGGGGGDVEHQTPKEASDDDDDDSKVAYVVEGQNYRKYRVEEKTDDGFIVGEYGVVDHNDGNLRGVRYTADSTINPSLIQKALLTFLKLK